MRVHPIVLEQIKNNAGIERARARSHGQPVHGGKAHCCGDTAAFLNCAHAGTVAEMGDDNPAVGGISRLLGRADMMFRKKVQEAIASHALGRQFARQREFLGERRLTSVEGSFEAGNLRHLGRNSADRTNCRYVVRLMQGREGDEFLKCGQYLVVDQHRIRISQAAVDHAMANSRESGLAADMDREPAMNGCYRALVIRAGNRPIDQLVASRVGNFEPRGPACFADPLYLSMHSGQKRSIGRSLEYRELAARRAGIDHKDRFAHATHPAIFPIAAAATR